MRAILSRRYLNLGIVALALWADSAISTPAELYLGFGVVTALAVAAAVMIASVAGACARRRGATMNWSQRFMRYMRAGLLQGEA